MRSTLDTITDAIRLLWRMFREWFLPQHNAPPAPRNDAAGQAEEDEPDYRYQPEPEPDIPATHPPPPQDFAPPSSSDFTTLIRPPEAAEARVSRGAGRDTEHSTKE